jgi:lactoylglutathione lyase
MVEIVGVSHLGVRVGNAERALAFYRLLGFELVARGEHDTVLILKNPAGVELNLIVNATTEVNLLMDVPEKHPGWTHVALAVASIERTVAELEALGIVISEGPLRLGTGMSLFVRDPDRNVIELRAQPA